MHQVTNYLHFLIFPLGQIQMKTQPITFSRYLPTDQQTRRWGWRLLDAGRQNIPSGADYPGKGHPLEYLFEDSGRRILDEFQVVFIATGKGEFESNRLSCRPVTAGDALLLFPGEWHRYQPDPATGWSEYWLGFKGQDAERIMRTFFTPESALLHTAQSDEIIRLFDQLLHWMKQPFPGVEQVTASIIPMILAFLQAGQSSVSKGSFGDAQLVMDAKSQMLNNLNARTDLTALAHSLGMSYSKFRIRFKEHTGYAPREFENLVKLNRACDLLRSGQYTVSQTAEALGYTSIYYFSRAFKKQFGKSPRDWLTSGN
jgi:AraC-like DNA-binding protein